MSTVTEPTQFELLIDNTEQQLKIILLDAPGRTDDCVFELRALKKKGRFTETRSGFYDSAHLHEMAADAIRLERQGMNGVYWTLNPVDRQLHAIRENREDQAGEGESAGDAHILRRRYLLIDFDPKRHPKISSSDAEKQLALTVCLAVRAFLKSLGWPEPLLADSGNGYHLLYYIDLPGDDRIEGDADTRGIVERCLKALAQQYSTEAVTVDAGNWNPARICKLYGTASCKGTSTQDRPHRRSRIMEIPDEKSIVPRALLEDLARRAPPDEKRKGKKTPAKTGRKKPAAESSGAPGNADDAGNEDSKNPQTFIRRWMREYMPNAGEPEAWQGNGLRWRLPQCPFNPDHVDGSAAILVMPEGGISFKCQHGSTPGEDGKVCADHTWSDVRDLIEERDPRPETCDLSDLGNARLFVKLHGEKVRYCYPWKKWLVWDGKRWKIDNTGEVERLAKNVADERWQSAQETNDSNLREFATDSASSKLMTAMLKLAQSEPGIPVVPDDLDRDPWLLNCANGVVDLRTGEIEPHRKSYLITKLCPTAFNPDTESYHFDKFLEAIFKGAQPLIDFLQRFLGYAITGNVREQILAILWGSGSNGKSTLLNAIMDTLGTDYCLKAVADLLMAKKHDSHPTERADLFGMRLVVCTETADGRGMNEALVKELTGGDKIRARRMREDFWEFDPTHKPILCTNHKPKVRGNDHAIWRRLVLVPFEVQFWNPDKGETGPAELRQDKALPATLIAEAEGILAWLVRGCLEWQKQGLMIPEIVRAATDSYRHEHDLIAMFIDDMCLGSPMCRIRASELYTAFKTWCDPLGEYPISMRAFGETIEQRGYEKKSSNGVWYLGIGMRADST